MNVFKKLLRGGAGGTELKLDDATKMVGCYKALAKIGFQDKNKENTKIPPMQRALAFCRSINLSKTFTEQFMNVVNDYRNSDEIDDEFKTDLEVELRHVDGTFNADLRNERLHWLEESSHNNVCRVLSNARCLAEGVDVPDLDAVLFLHPRKSQIDVVQSVGRVMRKADEKELGYVILPVTVAPGVSPERTLNDNKKFSVIWQILNALRAHDERLDSTINKIGLGEDVSNKIEIVGLKQTEKLDPTEAKIEHVRRRVKDRKPEQGSKNTPDQEEVQQLSFTLTEFSKAIKAKIVEKCGTRDYWENWATDIANIAKHHINRINGLLVKKNSPIRDAFDKFHEEIKDDLNPEVTESEAVEMLAQHMITKPVFDSLFQGNQFTEENSVSKALENTVERLYGANVDSEANTTSLRKFYKSVETRARGIETAKGRQTLILELYDRFFRKAFPLMTQKLGIVYTPTEVVDFIIRSVEDVLTKEFDSSLSRRGVHILDPFAGTGTFITRLLQSGIISNADLPLKYQNEIHANEIVLLANYISCINIESTYHDIINSKEYQPFNGMVLTDTFQLYEQERDMVADLLPDNSLRRTKQKEQDITVIMANPPYSAGQKDAGDGAANNAYPNLTDRIKQTYGFHSNSQNQRFLHDSYVRAIRWATDRINENGVIAFVCGAGWIDRKFADGMRKCLSEDFSKIYILHLRGDVRKDMISGTKEEGGNIFDQGSMTGIAIILLIKNPQHNGNAQIYFRDIGKNLNRQEKLQILKSLEKRAKIFEEDSWEQITPNRRQEWINQSNEDFYKFITLYNKSSEKEIQIFENYSLGVSTARDIWLNNYSEQKAKDNANRLITNYNSLLNRETTLNTAVVDSKNIKWSSGLKDRFDKNMELDSTEQFAVTSLYRPFTKTFLVTNKQLIERYYRNSILFPNPKRRNLVIAVSGAGSRAGFSVLMSDHIVNYSVLESSNCLPLFVFRKKAENEKGFFDKNFDDSLTRCDGITSSGLSNFRFSYPKQMVTKERLFYYIYGILHSAEYRSLFAHNLKAELPRIPAVRRFDDFIAFSEAGKKLGKLHIEYDQVEPYPVRSNEGMLKMFARQKDAEEYYRVDRMKFGKGRDDHDKSTVIYNRNITIEGIPLEAYDYIVSGKPALKWVMDQQCVKTDKKSGITNDANDYANEVMKDPAYPLKLFQRVITVSLETMKIVRNLPNLDID